MLANRPTSFFTNRMTFVCGKESGKSIFSQFGANLERIRESQNLTQAQLATDCDSDISYICRIENGKLSSSLIYLKKMADVMDIDLKELFNFD